MGQCFSHCWYPQKDKNNKQIQIKNAGSRYHLPTSRFFTWGMDSYCLVILLFDEVVFEGEKVKFFFYDDVDKAEIQWFL